MSKLVRFLTIGAALTLGITLSHGKESRKPSALPDPVAKTFKSAFPNAEPTTSEADEEDGVTVYDIEFTNGGIHGECDIAADGTLMENASTIDPKTVPDAVMKAIVNAAGDGVIGAVEKAEIHARAEHGKITPLETMRVEYEAGLTKGDRAGEITVASDGTVVEGPKWFKPGELVED